MTLKVVPDAPAPAPRPTRNQNVGSCVIPFPYQVWKDGLWQIVSTDPDTPLQPSLNVSMPPLALRGTNEVVQVTSLPIWLANLGVSLTDETDMVELAWLDARNGAKRTLWVPKLTVADDRELLKLASVGFPVSAVNKAKLVVYLDSLVAHNRKTLKWVDLSGRVGVVNTPYGVGYWVGEWIGPPGTQVHLDPNKTSRVKGYGVSGDRQVWLDKFWEEASRSPITRWLSFSTFASPLLRHVNRRTFIIHHWGTTGGGKSALVKLSLSVWGDPNKTMKHMNRTERSFIEVFQYTTDIGLAFDELQAATTKDPAKLIYIMCMETPRERAGQTGGLVGEDFEWKSVIRTTGEQALKGEGQIDRGGQHNRTIQIAADLLETKDAANLHRWCEYGHYGWGGKIFLENLVRVLTRNPNQLRKAYLQMEERLVEKGWEGLGDRVRHLAVVALAQTLAMMWLYDADEEYARDMAISDATEMAKLLAEDAEESQTAHAVALELLQDYAETDKLGWLELPEDTQKLIAKEYDRLYGVLVPERDEVWIMPQVAEKLFRAKGLQPRAVWREFEKAGWLTRSDTRRFAQYRTIAGWTKRVVVLNYSAFTTV